MVICMDDLKPGIIPTRFKAKISQELSFPAGAEKISIALAHTSQFQSLVLHFKSDRWRHVRFRRYACIAIAHSSRRADMSDQFLDSSGIPLFSEWQLDVFPVPRIYRHRIQQYIFAQALPEISVWLAQRKKLQHLGEESLRFSFDEEKDEFTKEIETRLQPHRN
jgi:hypothetical protein